MAAGQITETAEVGQLPRQILAMFGGVFLVYGALFAMGSLLYGHTFNSLLSLSVGLLGGGILWYSRKKV